MDPVDGVPSEVWTPDAVRPRQRAESESQVGICFEIHPSLSDERNLISTTERSSNGVATMGKGMNWDLEGESR
jgi:hypothetical protein